MKVVLSAVAAAAVFGMFASVAMADEVVTAKLQTPLAAPKKPIAGSAVFSCAADTCVAGNPVGETNSRSACHQLKRAVGPIAAFGSATRPLTTEQLAACNGK
jgi:curli biogenesis system outer membrane secretion channel CsgG